MVCLNNTQLHCCLIGEVTRVRKWGEDVHSPSVPSCLRQPSAAVAKRDVRHMFNHDLRGFTGRSSATQSTHLLLLLQGRLQVLAPAAQLLQEALALQNFAPKLQSWAPDREESCSSSVPGSSSHLLGINSAGCGLLAGGHRLLQDDITVNTRNDRRLPRIPESLAQER